MRSRSRFRSAVAIISFLLAGSSAHAAYIATLVQVGSDVVETGSGSLNVAGLTASGGTIASPGFASFSGVGFTNILGAGGAVDGYTYVPVGPVTTFTVSDLADSGSGATVGINVFFSGTGTVFVPGGYVSGASLGISTGTYANTTLAQLGLVSGTYMYSLMSDSANGPIVDTFTIQIGPAALTVPEPEPFALLGLGVAAITAARRKRSR